MKLQLALATAMVAMSIAATYGKECAGVQFPDEVDVQRTPVKLNGLGVRKATVFKVNIYVVALYLAEPSSDPRAILASDAPSELILQFMRAVRANELRKSWEEGFANNSPGHPPALEKGLKQLDGWVTDVKSGERVSFIRIPGSGMQVDVNGTVKGAIAGDEFARALLSIWLGENPQTPELKSGLLGGACG
ncbi:MAG: chalcone isomerase family protein [Steroidobacteraceae bacterium]